MSGGEAEVSAGGWLAGSCVLAGRWQALSTRHKGRARQRALRLRDGAIEIPREVRADVMVSSTHRKQYASRIFKGSLCVQTPSRHRLKNASALFLCNSLRAGLGDSPSTGNLGGNFHTSKWRIPCERYTVETGYPNTCPPQKQSRIAAFNCYLDWGQSAFVVNDKTAPRKERGRCVISCFLLQASHVLCFK